MPIGWIYTLIVLIVCVKVAVSVLKSEMHVVKKSIVIVLLVSLVMTLVVKFFIVPFRDDDSIDSEREYLNETVDLSLLIYGDDIEMPEGLNYKKVEDIKDKTIFLDNDYVYLIITDLSGNVSFTSDDFNRLIKYADSHPNFNFFYVGEDKLSMIDENYFEANINEDDLDFGYCTDDGDRILVGGIWNKDEEQYLKTKGTLVLGENIKRVVYGEIKSNE